MRLGKRMSRFAVDAKRNAMLWLNQGVSPRRLALTLALGLVVGCIPMLGVPTVLCAALAVVFRLNLPAMQAANYAVTPLQLALIVPFGRLGRWLVPVHAAAAFEPRALMHLPLAHLGAWLAGLAGQALLAWLLVAVPAVAFMTPALTRMLRRIPVLSHSEE